MGSAGSSPSFPRSSRSEAARVAANCASALACALSIATCAAAPEFVWQGLLIISHHLGWTDLVGALLIGLILAFFVEPLIERARGWLHGHGHHDPARRNPLFSTGLGLAFALVSVCVHDAITSFVSGKGGPPAEGGSSVIAGVALAVSWALVPSVITLAWLSAAVPRLRVVTGLLAASSSFLAAWLFGWGLHSALTTAAPCVLILSAGYVVLAHRPASHALPACALAVALIGTLWLVAATLLDWSGWTGVALYTASTLGEDARFYAGWAVGLLLAPWPFTRPSAQ